MDSRDHMHLVKVLDQGQNQGEATASKIVFRCDILRPRPLDLYVTEKQRGLRKF